MYEQFYGLKERPFSLTPDPDYLYPSSIHTQALTRLSEGLTNGTDLIVLTGEIGSGKTTLLHAALRAVNPHTAVSWIVNTQLDARELVEAIVLGFGLEPRPDSSEARLIEYLARFLGELQDVGRGALLIIDEAQNLGLLSLDHMLIALEEAHAPPLHVILVGQPSLSDLLRTKELHRLRQRIGIRYHLRALDAPETASYINHRLRHASLGEAVEFPEAVSALIHQQSRGLPRRINVLSDTVLIHAYGEGRRTVALDIASVALKELERTGASASLAFREPSDEPAHPRDSIASFETGDLPLQDTRPDVPRLQPGVREFRPEPLVAADLPLRESALGPAVSIAAVFDDREIRRSPPRNRLFRPVVALAAALVMTVVAAAPGFRKSAPVKSAAPEPLTTTGVLPVLEAPAPPAIMAIPDLAATSGISLPQPQAATLSQQSTSLNQTSVPIPPLSQRPDAGLPPAAAPVTSAPAVESVNSRSAAFPPVAEASLQSLTVVPVPRNGPSLPVPPRIPTVETPAGTVPPAPLPSQRPAPAVASAPTSALSAAATDERSVRAVVDQYRAAFSALNASAAKAVWPSVDARALDRAFSQLQSQSFQFEGCEVSVAGVLATARCGGTARFVPKVGDRTPRVEPRTWTFQLLKSNSEWTLQRVLAR